eukprot:COSAG01_NODE_751_length_13837_cov_78.727981_10_plen_138_part_00
MACIALGSVPVYRHSLTAITFSDSPTIRQYHRSAGRCRVTADASGPADVRKCAHPPFGTFNHFRSADCARPFGVCAIVLVIPCSQSAALACRDAPVGRCSSAPVVRQPPIHVDKAFRRLSRGFQLTRPGCVLREQPV